MEPTPDELRSRIDALEKELTRVTTERDLYKESADAELANIPYTPMTEDEARNLIAAPQGERLLDIAAEFERRALGRG
jgi:hypothetical protein